MIRLVVVGGIVWLFAGGMTAAFCATLVPILPAGLIWLPALVVSLVVVVVFVWMPEVRRRRDAASSPR